MFCLLIDNDIYHIRQYIIRLKINSLWLHILSPTSLYYNNCTELFFFHLFLLFSFIVFSPSFSIPFIIILPSSSFLHFLTFLSLCPTPFSFLLRILLSPPVALVVYEETFIITIIIIITPNIISIIIPIIILIPLHFASLSSLLLIELRTKYFATFDSLFHALCSNSPMSTLIFRVLESMK